MMMDAPAQAQSVGTFGSVSRPLLHERQHRAPTGIDVIALATNVFVNSFRHFDEGHRRRARNRNARDPQIGTKLIDVHLAAITSTTQRRNTHSKENQRSNASFVAPRVDDEHSLRRRIIVAVELLELVVRRLGDQAPHQRPAPVHLPKGPLQSALRNFCRRSSPWNCNLRRGLRRNGQALRVGLVRKAEKNEDKERASHRGIVKQKGPPAESKRASVLSAVVVRRQCQAQSLLAASKMRYAMAKPKRTSDSMSARPRMRGVWILSFAPGLRAMPSSAAEAARP